MRMKYKKEKKRYIGIIRFFSIIAQFGIGTVVGVNGTLVDAKMYLGNLNIHILASISVPFRPTTVPMPHLALIEMKRITVCI